MKLDDVSTLTLSASEREVVSALVAEALGGSAERPLDELLPSVRVLAQELPRRVREAFYAFATEEAHVALRVAGGPWDEAALPATPARLREPGGRETVRWYDVAHLMYASLLGEPFCWSTIQDGYLLNDVMPVSDDETDAISSSSRTTFDLHTEDAFHPLAGHYLGLLCVRNPYEVGTVVATLPVERLPADVVDVLFQPRFVVGANLAQRVPRSERRVPVLFGSRRAPYFRVNVNVSACVEHDPEADRAYRAFVAALTANAARVVLRGGEYWYFDNYRVAHGREPFTAAYDGGDRWLRRLYISESLRASRHLRGAPGDRVVTPYDLLDGAVAAAS